MNTNAKHASWREPASKFQAHKQPVSARVYRQYTALLWRLLRWPDFAGGHAFTTLASDWKGGYGARRRGDDAIGFTLRYFTSPHARRPWRGRGTMIAVI